MRVPVDDGRRASAEARRRNIIHTLTREFDLTVHSSVASRFRAILASEAPRQMIMSGDIDGLVSAAMLAKACPEWRVVAVIVKSGRVLIHPGYVDGLDAGRCFGVDVFSTRMDNVSNHVALWGGKRLGGSAAAFAAAQAYDREVQERSRRFLHATPSLWAGIEGSYPEAGPRATTAGYRYPLGTAHVLLALLEAVEKSPRLFDRDYLPWLVANCDGGLKTMRDYAHNVPMWWSCLAAIVGPASLSEHLYQLAANQRPTEFVEVVNRLRAEGASAAKHLTDDWNLRSQLPESIAAVMGWLTGISGWPDPVLDGSGTLTDWTSLPLTDHGHLLTTGLPVGATVHEREEGFKYGLRRSLEAVHTNFNYFDGRQRLNWVAPWEGLSLPQGAVPRELEASLETPAAAAQQDVGDFAV